MTIQLSLPKNLQQRPATWDDVGIVVALLNASSQSTRGTDSTAVHWQKRHWYESEETEEKSTATEPNPEESDPEVFDNAYFNSPGLCFVAWDGDDDSPRP